ncbi:MAG: methyltransferase domain-containing protein [Acidobacteriota bacterium]|nr:methyltransferase domain-containing protein [Acidobacteriota bacterium]
MEQFKISDSSSYNAVAGHFDRFTNIVTAPLARTIVRLSQLHAGQSLLDIGTGSGIVALNAAGSPASPAVTGIDLSDGLLAIAQHNTREAGLTGRIRFVKGDAEALPFADASYHAAVSLFALLHFPHPDRALAEMYRVLKPGGRLVVGIGSPPPWTTVQGWLHRLGRVRDLLNHRRGKLLLAPAHLDRIVARHVPARGASEETEMAKHRGARAGTAVSLIRRLGLVNVKTHWEGRHLILNEAEEFWDLQSTFSSFSRKRLESAPESQIRAVRDHFNDDCRRVLGRGGKLVYHYAAYYISGRRP